MQRKLIEPIINNYYIYCFLVKASSFRYRNINIPYIPILIFFLNYTQTK